MTIMRVEGELDKRLQADAKAANTTIAGIAKTILAEHYRQRDEVKEHG